MSFVTGNTAISPQTALKRTQQGIENAQAILEKGDYSEESKKKAEKIIKNSLTLLKPDTGEFAKSIKNKLNNMLSTVQTNTGETSEGKGNLVTVARELGVTSKKIKNQREALAAVEKVNLALIQELAEKVAEVSANAINSIFIKSQEKPREPFKLGENGKETVKLKNGDVTFLLLSNPEDPRAYIIDISGNGDNFHLDPNDNTYQDSASGLLLRNCQENDVAFVGVRVGTDEQRRYIYKDTNDRSGLRERITDIAERIKESDPDAVIVVTGHSTGGTTTAALTYGTEDEKEAIERLYDLVDYIVPISINSYTTRRIADKSAFGQGQFYTQDDKTIYVWGNEGASSDGSEKYTPKSDEISNMIGEHSPEEIHFGRETTHHWTASTTFFGNRYGEEGILDRIIEEHDSSDSTVQVEPLQTKVDEVVENAQEPENNIEIPIDTKEEKEPEQATKIDIQQIEITKINSEPVKLETKTTIGIEQIKQIATKIIETTKPNSGPIQPKVTIDLQQAVKPEVKQPEVKMEEEKKTEDTKKTEDVKQPTQPTQPTNPSGQYKTPTVITPTINNNNNSDNKQLAKDCGYTMVGDAGNSAKIGYIKGTGNTKVIDIMIPGLDNLTDYLQKFDMQNYKGSNDVLVIQLNSADAWKTSDDVFKDIYNSIMKYIQNGYKININGETNSEEIVKKLQAYINAHR